MVRRLGDEHDRIDRRGIDAHLGDQPRSGVGAQVERRDPVHSDHSLAQPDDLAGSLQGGAIDPGGHSVLHIIPLDGTGRHGEAGDTEIGKLGVH